MWRCQKLNSKLTETNIMNHNNKDTATELEYQSTLKWTPCNKEKYFLKYRFESFRKYSRSVPRRSKSSFHNYKLNRPLSFELTDTRKENLSQRLSNSSLGNNSNDMTKRSSRDLTRSAKIMRALSLYHDRDAGIRKSLNFDSSPDSKKNCSLEEDVLEISTPSSISGKSLRLNTSLIDSSPDSLLIDENQNRTPQQNRKLTKMSSDTKKDANRSRSSTNSSTSSLRSNLKEKIDDIVQMSHLKIMAQRRSADKSRALNSDITSRNLFHEFIRIEHEDGSPTPSKNTTHLTRRSAVKRSLNMNSDCHGKQMLIHHTEAKSEASGASNISASDNYTASIDQSQEESAKEMLSDTSPLLSNQLTSNDEEDQNICNEERILRAQVQGELSRTCNDEIEQRSGEVSLESNPSIPQNSEGAVTPENRVNILQRICTESIKKSHKKIKRENRKALIKRNILHHETARIEPKASDAQDTQNNSNDNSCEDVTNELIDVVCVSSSQNFDRPSTPENINSSRLLLSQFSSIKKSHRKNKRDNRKSFISSFEDYSDDYTRKANQEMLRNKKYAKGNTNNLLTRNELHRSRKSSPNNSLKRKRMGVFSESETHELFESSLTGCENIDEFPIHIPISPDLLTDTEWTCTDETSPDEDKFTQIDCLRCSTPLTSCVYSLDSELERSARSILRGKCVNISKKLADIVDQTENTSGRCTPINMPTTELLSSKNSIKKSHKKNKHNRSTCKRRITGSKQSTCNIEENENINFANNGTKNLEEHTTPSSELSISLDNSTEMGTYSDKHENIKSCERATTTAYDEPQPSTSRVENNSNIDRSKHTIATPPNNSNTSNFIKLLRTTSIKKSHRKERNRYAQTKYILMSEEHDISDDGSIFDEEAKFISTDNLCQDNDNEKIVYS